MVPVARLESPVVTVAFMPNSVIGLSVVVARRIWWSGQGEAPGECPPLAVRSSTSTNHHGHPET